MLKLKKKSYPRLLMPFLLVTFLFCVLLMPFSPVYADDPTGAPDKSVSDVVTEIYNETETEAKTIADNAIFPGLRILLAIMFIVAAAVAGIGYHKSREINWGWVIVAGVCLIVSVVGPKFIWELIA